MLLGQCAFLKSAPIAERPRARLLLLPFRKRIQEMGICVSSPWIRRISIWCTMVVL